MTILDDITCPITSLIFLEPVVTNTGITYEYEAILKWLETHETCPKTNRKIISLSKNFSLKSIIDEYLNNNKDAEQYIKSNNNIKYDDCFNFPPKNFISVEKKVQELERAYLERSRALEATYVEKVQEFKRNQEEITRKFKKSREESFKDYDFVYKTHTTYKNIIEPKYNNIYINYYK